MYIFIPWFCQMVSVWRTHPEKWLTEPFYTDAVYGWDYPDTDTDDKKSPNVIQLVPLYPDKIVRILIRRHGKEALHDCCCCTSMSSPVNAIPRAADTSSIVTGRSPFTKTCLHQNAGRVDDCSYLKGHIIVTKLYNLSYVIDKKNR